MSSQIILIIDRFKTIRRVSARIFLLLLQWNSNSFYAVTIMVFKFSVIILHLLIVFCWNHKNYI